MRQPSAQSIRIPVVAAAAAALITYGVTVRPGTRSKSPDVAPAESVSQSTPRRQRDSLRARVARARFYDESVLPLIAETTENNLAAADRCLQRLDQVMQSYHAGVEKFVGDMTSLRTRFGVLKRMPGGWWAGDDRVEVFVHEKFETHLFSEQQLVDDISGVLILFRAEVDANQTALLAGVQAALTTADLPEITLEDQDAFFRELAQDLDLYATDQGTTSVQNMIGAFVLGEVGAFAARSVVGGLLARFAPSVAIGSAAGASAAVGASATGAGGGSLGGPVGAVVGFGAGLVVGLVIDWWMTERFESQLTEQMHGYLDELHQTLLSGGQGQLPGDEKNQGESVGLRDALPELCRQLDAAYRDRFFTQIVDVETP